MNKEQAITAYKMQCKGYIFTTNEDNELGTRALVTFGQCDITDYDIDDRPKFEPYVFDGDKVIMIYDNDDEDINYDPSVIDISQIQCWGPQEMNW